MDLGTVWKGECRVLGTGGNAPGARTVKGPGAEKGALPRDPQAPVVALAELLHSSTYANGHRAGRRLFKSKQKGWPPPSWSRGASALEDCKW